MNAPKQFHVGIHDDILTRQLLIFVDVIEGDKLFNLTSAGLEPMSDGERRTPLVAVTRRAGKDLLHALAAELEIVLHGKRPVDEVQALKAHLEDMRKIVFDRKPGER